MLINNVHIGSFLYEQVRKRGDFLEAANVEWSHAVYISTIKVGHLLYKRPRFACIASCARNMKFTFHGKEKCSSCAMEKLFGGQRKDERNLYINV
jgi:hypothetical protein